MSDGFTEEGLTVAAPNTGALLLKKLFLLETIAGGYKGGAVGLTIVNLKLKTNSLFQTFKASSELYCKVSLAADVKYKL